MKIHIIRHAPTQEWEQDILLWELEGTLSESGKREYHIIIEEFFQKISPNCILCSALNRNKESAKLWQGKFPSIPLIEDSLLNEKKLGKSAWKSSQEINWQEYEKLPFLERKHKWWESYLEVLSRAKKFLKNLQKSDYNEVLIIGHSAWIIAFLSIINQESIEKIIEKKEYNNFVTREIL